MSVPVVGFSGSLRRASRNAGLLRAAAAALPEVVQFTQVSLADLPFYNQDITEKPESVCRLVREVTQARALVLACAEYNYSLAPALKNALDWLSREPDNRPLDGKPVLILGAGGGMGTARAQYHLRQCCVYLNLRPLNRPEIFSNAFGPDFADNGDLLDATLIQRIGEGMQALVAQCQA